MTSQAVMKRYINALAKKNQSNLELQKLSTAINNFKKLTKEQQGKVNKAVETAYEKLQAKGVSVKKVVSKPTTASKQAPKTNVGLKPIISQLKNQLGASSFKAATTNTNIAKDIKLPALKKGKRIVRKAGYTTNEYGTFKNKVGSTYYENRANRYDANQPSTTRKYKLADGGNIDKNIRFDVDFYDDNNTRKETSVELILRGSSLDNVIKDAIKKAYELKKNYIEFYNRNSFLGSINLAISSDFREGRDYREGNIKLADGGSLGEVKVGDFFINTTNGEKFYIEKIDKKDKSYPFYVIKSKTTDLPEVISIAEWNRYSKNGLFERVDGKFAKGGVPSHKVNLSFQYNPGNLSNEEAERIVSKYTKDWKHDNDFDEVSFYVFGLTRAEAVDLRRELKMEDTYNIEMDNSQYAKGGTTSSLSSIRRKYDKNEDENRHSENVVLLATNFGDADDLKLAKEILRKHNKEGGLSSENGQKRRDLHLKLITKAREEFKKEGLEFAKGGKTGDMYVAVGEKDGYWTIIGRPSSKEKAQELLDLPNSLPRGEVGKVVSVEDAKNHKFVVGREYLRYAKGGLTEHGLKVGDEIVLDAKKTIKGQMPTTIGVRDYDKEFHLVDLDKGKRYADGGETSDAKNKKIMEEYRVEVSDLRNQSYPRMSPSLAFKKASEYMLFRYTKQELAEAIKNDSQIEMFGMEKTWLNALAKAKKPSKMANGGVVSETTKGFKIGDILQHEGDWENYELLEIKGLKMATFSGSPKNLIVVKNLKTNQIVESNEGRFDLVSSKMAKGGTIKRIKRRSC